MYSLILLATSALAAPASVDTPTVCLATTISASGRTERTRVVEGSGNRGHDRGAKRYLEVLDFARMPPGVALGQSGHVIVRVLGPDTWSVDLTGGALHENCDAARAAGANPPPATD